MAVLLLFTAIGLAIFVLALLALAWSVRSGQLDDLETPALRAVADDAHPAPAPRPGPSGTAP